MIEKKGIKTKQCTLSALFCLLLFENVIAQQNLVHNESFENYTICPFKFSKNPPSDWYIATNSISNYANSCDTSIYASVPRNIVRGYSFQYAKKGNGYILLDYVNGPGANQRSYIQTKLKDSLRGGKLYYVEHFVNSPNSQKLACNNVGALLTKTAVYVDTNTHPYGVLPANPQILNYGNPIIADTINWIKVSGIFKAQGGEQYLTLGNFKYDNQTSYTQFLPTGYACAGYYIDDVSVIPLDSICLKADAGRDTAISLGDSVFIGSYTNGIDSVKWLNGNVVIDSARPGFWVKPTVTTSYILQQVVNGCFSADTVVVTVGTVPLKFISLTLNPSPKGEGLETRIIWQTANEINVSHFNIQRSTNVRDFINVGKLAANNKSYNEYHFTDGVSTPSPLGAGWGEAYYRIESVDNDGRKQYSEVRQLTIRNDKLGISIYPNPSKGMVHIKLPMFTSGQWNINVTDMYGKTIINKHLVNSDIEVNIGTTKGLYIVRVTNTQSGETLTNKIIVN